MCLFRNWNFFYSCLRVKGNYANISYNLNRVLATTASVNTVEHHSSLGILGRGVGGEPHVLSMM